MPGYKFWSDRRFVEEDFSNIPQRFVKPSSYQVGKLFELRYATQILRADLMTATRRPSIVQGTPTLTQPHSDTLH